MNNQSQFSLVEKTNQEQIKAANPNVSVWASANAGAGKTKVLIDRIARLLLYGTPPEKILAVTYTKAAAAEMTSRLFQTLGRWAVAEDDELRAGLQKLDEKVIPNLDQARALFARALETPGGLKIETIHAFCGAILKRFPLEAGVSPGFEVIEDIGAGILAAKAFEKLGNDHTTLYLNLAARTFGENQRDIIRAASALLGNDEFNFANTHAKLTKAFNLEQSDANGYTIEIAKSRAINTIDRELVRECVQILLESSSRDISLAHKLEEALAGSEDDFIATFVDLIINDANELRQSSPITKKVENNGAICRLFGEPVKNDNWIGGQLLDFWQEAQIVQGMEIREATLELLQAADIWRKNYQLAKRSAGKLDFADLLSATSGLLNRANGGALWVLYKLDQGLAHVLIDESQDTSAEQWELLTPLLEALEDHTYDKFAKGPRTQFVVGDEKQSIYSFQGASPARFEIEKAKFLEARIGSANEFPTKRISIPFDVSFRTGQTILDGVDAVWQFRQIATGKEQKGLELETKFERAQNHYSARTDEASQIELWPLELALKKEKDREAWDIPLNSESETSAPNLLATRIAREIRRRIDAGELVWDKDENRNKISRPLKESDIMILVQQRKTLFHSLIRKLKGENLKVAGADQIILNQDPAILDLIALGRFVLRPEDDFNLACVLKGAFCGLVDDDRYLFPLAYKRGITSLWNKLRENKSAEFRNSILFLEAQTKRFEDTTPFEFFAKLLEMPMPDGRTGWQAILERFGHEAREPLEVFLDSALNADKLGALGLSGFLDIIEYKSSSVKRDLNGDDDGVKVMTVHAAKGREAKVVILPDTTRAPSSRSNGLFLDDKTRCIFWVKNPFYIPQIVKNLKEVAKAKAVDENNRLLYVAMTRARDRLILCGHQYNKKYSKESWFSNFELSNQAFGTSRTRELSRIPTDDESAIFAEVWGEEITQKPIEKITGEIENLVLPEWLKATPIDVETRARRIAPSMMVGEDESESFLAPSVGANNNRFLRGRTIHALLEGFPRIAPSKREKWADEKLRGIKALSNSAKAEIIGHALGIVNDEKFAPFFGENSRAEVSLVGKSKLLPDDITISGTIDRLIINTDTVLVLDFKTNRPPPKDINGLPKVYLNQMAAYYALLSETFPKHKIRCALLWTDTPVLMEIPQTMIDAALTIIK